MYQQAVVRLCQGAVDKEAGSYASNIRPKNIEDAIDKIPWPHSGSIPVYPPFWGMDLVIVLYTYLFDFSSPPP
jgi:hypothetical protein